MTRKDFNAIAAALNSTKPDSDNGHNAEQWMNDIHAMANVCASTNANFDRVRFTKACLNGLNAKAAK